LSELIACGSEDTSKWARLLLDNVHDLITVLSLKGTFLYVSPSVERLLGYKADEMVGKSISEFCHPSDVVPVFRELKDSTSNASIAAAARHWARMDGTVNPPTKGGAGQTGPQVNLIMRMRHKERGFGWIENVGKLHLEQGKGRKVVISTGRARPVYNLPWEQARRSLDYKGPAFWSKVSQSGIILSTSGTVGDVLYTEAPSRSEVGGKSIVGMHVNDVVDSEAREAISTGLQSLNVTGIPHQMTNGAGGRPVTVMSTLIPSSAGGQGLPTVFMHTQRVSMSDLGTLQLNKIHTQDANVSQSEAGQAAMLKTGEPRNDSVFGELSTQRSTSWVFELHQLKIANKRLREEIRCHQRRISGGKPTVIVPPPSPSKTKSAASKTQPSSKSFLSVAKNSKGNSSDSTSDASMEPSPSPFNSGSGSGTESSGATTVDSGSGSDNPTSSGFKRSRS
jgi:PAS domain S-box-containing protein